MDKIMRTIIYTYKDAYTRLIYRCRIDNVHTVADEPYPPGGFLRVAKNAQGQMLSGPLVSELMIWQEFKIL